MHDFERISVKYFAYRDAPANLVTMWTQRKDKRHILIIIIIIIQATNLDQITEHVS